MRENADRDQVHAFVAEIPKGAAGKIQRIGLAEKLDL
jgi:hypothetical protein